MPNSPYFRIEMLPAKHGDALWIEYGTDPTRPRRVVIDGGPLNAYPQVEARFGRLPDGDRRVELLVITHVDTDHIEGAIRLLAIPRQRWPFAPEDIWFNGFRHLRPQHNLGGREGEFLSALIKQRAFKEWNKAFTRGAVVVADSGPLPVVTIEGGMTLTLLSPGSAQLEKLAKSWEKDLAKWAIDPGDLEAAWQQLVDTTRFHPDSELTLGPGDLTDRLRAQLKAQDAATANGSSIAFLAEYERKACLFLADAHMDVVCASLTRLGATAQQPLKVDAVKVSHHGSKRNISPELLELVDAEHFLISTNGDRHQHPDAPAIETITVGARRRPTLWFNYRSPTTEGVEKAARAPGARFTTRYPGDGDEGITVPL